MSTTARTSTLRAVPASPIAGTRHRPLPIPSVRLVGGPLAAWQQRNGEATIPHCIEQLEVSGVLDNFRRLLGESDAGFRGLVFADSDLYKVIEAVAWEIARTRTRAFDSWLDDVIALVARVQEPSGYVDPWIQGVAPEKKFAALEWTHEMYVAGHLIQAAVALARADGRTDLLDVARRLADLLVERFGPGVVGPEGARERDGDGYARVPLEPGARYVLDLDLTPRLTTAHHRVDALRAAVAVEGGPVVYCVEQADLDAPFDVDDLAVLPAPISVGERDTLVLRCRVIIAADGLYGPDTAAELGDEHAVTAIPFSTWGNRAPGPMRVWLPRALR